MTFARPALQSPWPGNWAMGTDSIHDLRFKSDLAERQAGSPLNFALLARGATIRVHGLLFQKAGQ